MRGSLSLVLDVWSNHDQVGELNLTALVATNQGIKIHERIVTTDIPGGRGERKRVELYPRDLELPSGTTVEAPGVIRLFPGAIYDDGKPRASDGAVTLFFRWHERGQHWILCRTPRTAESEEASDRIRTPAYKVVTGALSGEVPDGMKEGGTTR